MLSCPRAGAAIRAAPVVLAPVVIAALLAPRPAAQDLYSERVFPAQDSPESIVTMHLDADGLPDVVVGNLGSFTRMLAAGDATFDVLPPLPAGQFVTRLLVVDMNADGIDDLVALARYQGELSVWLGDGNGGLAPSDAVDVGGNLLQDVAAGDLDEDGHLDLVTANESSNTLSVLFGDGAGGLASPVAVAVGGQPKDVAIGDLDEDGHLDVASANYTFPGTLSLLFGDGTGAFAPAVTFKMGPTSGWYADALAVVDIDEDGHLDLVCDGAVRLGDGTGAFDTVLPAILPSTRCTVVDFDEDGHLDVICGSSIRLGDGQGGIVSTTAYYSGNSPNESAVADYDTDGDLDIAVVNRNPNHFIGTVKLFVNDGSGAFGEEGFVRFATGAAAGVERLLLADLDRDGLTDALTSHSSPEQMVLFRNDGEGGFLAPTPLLTGLVAYDVALGDVDGDGDLDVAALAAPTFVVPTSVTLLLSDGLGGFATSTVGLGAEIDVVALGDVDEDGFDDLLGVSRDPDQLIVRLSDGAGGFGPSVSTQMFISGGQTARLLAVDLDGDGHLDALASKGGAEFHVLHGDGSGGFGLQVDHDGLGGPIVPADLDGDGDLDIVGTLSSTGDQWVGTMLAGPGGFGEPAYFFDDYAMGHPAVADVDADGDLDIVVSSSQSSDFTVLLGDGAGGFTLHGRFRAGGQALLMAIADLDGSGFPELVGLCSHSGQGIGTFVSLLPGITPSPWRNVGHALAGGHGVPTLAGSGTLQPGSPVTLSIDDGRPSGTAVIAIGTPAIDAPFKGGVFVPTPQLLVFGLPLDADGHFSGSGTWYAGIPPGVPIYFQAWIPDPTAPVGYAATNGLEGTTP